MKGQQVWSSLEHQLEKSHRARSCTHDLSYWLARHSWRNQVLILLSLGEQSILVGEGKTAGAEVASGVSQDMER